MLMAFNKTIFAYKCEGCCKECILVVDDRELPKRCPYKDVEALFKELTA